MAVLHYGSNSSVRLDFADGAPLELGMPRGEPLADLAAATIAALREPIDYPTLAQCTTPGDRVVVALDRGLPQKATVTAAVVNALVEAGVDADGITVLESQAGRRAGGGDPRQLLSAPLRQRVSLAAHDPDDRRELAYLAADGLGEPILINRALHEADVVLPVGCLRGEQSAGYFDIHGVIYPTFSDTRTLQRFRAIATLNGQAARRRELVADVDHVAWLLGITLTVQLVPAAGEGVLQVLAGLSDSVRRRGRDQYHAAWDWPVQRQADLVLAAIEGGPGQQTWENLGRALHVAENFVSAGGAIAVCCELSAPPGPAMQHLAGESSREAALRHVAKKRPADALPAAQLVHALDHSKVYLLSRLDAAVVEDLEMIPIGGADELARLARKHRSCILLSNAANVTVVEDEGLGDEE
ncbi:MAG: lactate racemase domain-containing protein [Thermoguttaceae bacterium]